MADHNAEQDVLSRAIEAMQETHDETWVMHVADWLAGVLLALQMDDPRLGAYPMHAERNAALNVACAFLGEERPDA